MKEAKRLLKESKKILKESKKILKEDTGNVTLNFAMANETWNNVYDKLFDISINGPMIYAKQDDAPTPYDAGILIKGDNFVLEGSAGPSGFGSAVVSVPKGSASNVWNIELELNDEDSKLVLDKLLTGTGVTYA